MASLSNLNIYGVTNLSDAMSILQHIYIHYTSQGNGYRSIYGVCKELTTSVSNISVVFKGESKNTLFNGILYIARDINITNATINATGFFSVFHGIGYDGLV